MINKLLGGALVALLLITFDHAMRVDQQRQCEQEPVTCPTGLWLWSN